MNARPNIATERRPPALRNVPFPTRLIEDHLALSALLWAALLIIVLGVAVGNHIWDSVSGSYWDDASSSVPQWFAAFIAGYLAYSYLPAMIAHGQTRRESGQQAFVFLLVFSAALAVMVAVGFGIEAALFAVMDWPHEIDGGHLFTSSGQVHLVLVEYLTRFMVWAAAGFVVGAGFYRSEESGGGTLAVAWIPVAATEFAVGTQYGSPLVLFRFVWDPPGLHPVLVVAVGLLSFAALVWLGWKMIRDIPIQTKSS